MIAYPRIPGQIHPYSCCSDWLDWYPHEGYTHADMPEDPTTIATRPLSLFPPVILSLSLIPSLAHANCPSCQRPRGNTSYFRPGSTILICTGMLLNLKLDHLNAFHPCECCDISQMHVQRERIVSLKIRWMKMVI